VSFGSRGHTAPSRRCCSPQSRLPTSTPRTAPSRRALVGSSPAPECAGSRRHRVKSRKQCACIRWMMNDDETLRNLHGGCMSIFVRVRVHVLVMGRLFRRCPRTPKLRRRRRRRSKRRRRRRMRKGKKGLTRSWSESVPPFSPDAAQPQSGQERLPSALCLERHWRSGAWWG
jgi:hypothetical protein